MTAFAQAVDVLFADPNLGLDALWLSKGQSEPVPVRIVRQMPDIETAYGQTRLVTESAVFAVRVVEVPGPGKGDSIEVDGDTFTVSAEPRRDPLRLTWTVEARLKP